MSAPDPRANETRRRLVAAGLELFGRHGFDAVTTRQLAEVADVNQAAIPYHFRGKEGVYLAVAEYVAEETSRQVKPVLDSARVRLAAAPSRDVVQQLLLDTVLAIARAFFEPEHRGVWFTFLTREQFHPSSAFEYLYEQFAGPVHILIGELIGRLTGNSADAENTILLTHAFLGQFVGFSAARATLNRRLGREGDLRREDVDGVIAAIESLTKFAICGMAKGR